MQFACYWNFNPFAVTFPGTKTPSSVQISSVNERGRTVPEHALMNEPVKHPVLLLYNTLACWP